VGNFYTDTIKGDARFKTIKVVADMKLLEPVFRQTVESILADAKAHGLNVKVFETYRSQARQTRLFNEGATTLKTVGVHHYGLSCDIVRVVNGQPSWKGDFSFLGEFARAYGLIWGGDWSSFNDPYHLQRCTIKRQGSLFRGEWYPDPDYNPLIHG
jgi:hypothetical protein